MDDRLVGYIEDEFGEPIRDIIEVMRQQGYKWRTIAGALGINMVTLRSWRKELGLEINRFDIVRDNQETYRPDLLAQEYGYKTMSELLWDWRMVKDMMVKDIAEILGVSQFSVSRWSPEAARGNITEKAKKIYTDNLNTPSRGDGRTWRSTNKFMYNSSDRG